VRGTPRAVAAAFAAGAAFSILVSFSASPSYASVAPDAPTAVQAVPGDASAVVSWQAPANVSGSPVLDYVVMPTPVGPTCSVIGLSAACSGLLNLHAYSFTVVARSSAGESLPSAPSVLVTPSGAGARVSAVADVSASGFVPGAQVFVGWCQAGNDVLQVWPDKYLRLSTINALCGGSPHGRVVTSRSNGAVGPVTLEAPSGWDVANETFYPLNDWKSRSGQHLNDSYFNGLVAINLDNLAQQYFSCAALEPCSGGPDTQPGEDPTYLGYWWNGPIPFRLQDWGGHPHSGAMQFRFLHTGRASALMSGIANHKLNVSWGRALQDEGAPLAGYRVSAFPGASSCAVAYSDTSPRSSCQLTGLENGKQYVVSVQVVRSDGSVGPPATVSATPADVPTAPLRLRGAGGGANGAYLEWDAPTSTNGNEVATYTVQSAPAGGACHVLGRKAYCDGFAGGHNYTFTVRALNDVGSSLPSAPVKIEIPVRPTPAFSAVAVAPTRYLRGESAVFSATLRFLYTDGVWRALPGVSVDLQKRTSAGWVKVRGLLTAASGRVASRIALPRTTSLRLVAAGRSSSPVTVIVYFPTSDFRFTNKLLYRGKSEPDYTLVHPGEKVHIQGRLQVRWTDGTWRPAGSRRVAVQTDSGGYWHTLADQLSDARAQGSVGSTVAIRQSQRLRLRYGNASFTSARIEVLPAPRTLTAALYAQVPCGAGISNVRNLTGRRGQVLSSYVTNYGQAVRDILFDNAGATSYDTWDRSLPYLKVLFVAGAAHWIESSWGANYCGSPLS